MLVALLPLAVVLSLPPTDATSRYQLDADLHLTPAIAHWPELGTSDSPEVSAGAQLQLTLFIQRVRDDDAPLSLQPFLQRVARFTVAAGAAVGFSYPFSEDERSPSAQSFGGPMIHTSIDGYVGRYVYLAAGVGYQFEHRWSDASATDDLHEPSLDVAVGVRVGDVRVAATADGTYVSHNGDGIFWGNVGLRAHAVSHRHIELDGGAALLLYPAKNGRGFGASADLSATYWIKRRLGLGCGAFYRLGFATPFGIQTDTQGGGFLSMKWWMSPHSGLSLTFRTTWENDVYDDSIESRTDLSLTLGLTIRP